MHDIQASRRIDDLEQRVQLLERRVAILVNCQRDILEVLKGLRDAIEKLPEDG